MKKLLISIITSEKTWTNFSKFGFDKEILRLRDQFDLSFVLNGYSNEAILFYNQFCPEYFFLRPNLGFDTASIAYLINLVPRYEHYLIMHDDHWFPNPNWIDRLYEIMNNNSDTDIFGNILMQEPMRRHGEYCQLVNLNEFSKYKDFAFLHGMSGLFNLRSIQLLKEFKVPYLLTDEKEIAFLGERLFSNILSHQGIKFSQFSEGIFNFFLHGENNYINYLFSSANVAFHQSDFIKAKDYFYKYYHHCSEKKYFQNMDSLFNNLASTHYQLGEYSEAKYIWENLIERLPNYPIPNEARILINN
ncbi:MAG: hypothetical protein KJ571_07990 [Bacteroidetes bacterium]|nr:hypothetical protein [Bacteroidota bacterium]